MSGLSGMDSSSDCSPGSGLVEWLVAPSWRGRWGVGDVANPAQAAVDLAKERNRIAAHAIADAIIRAETAEAALQRTQTERDCMSAALGQEIAGLTAEVARLGMVIEALRHTSTEGNWARVIERDARRKALEEALSIVQREKDSGRHPDKLARVIHELRALAAREVGRG